MQHKQKPRDGCESGASGESPGASMARAKGGRWTAVGD